MNSTMLALINYQHAPWLGFHGRPGSKEYAENVAAWLSRIFPQEKYKAVESAGWWSAEEENEVDSVPSASTSDHGSE